MTAEQIDLASKIRSLIIMFSDTECDKIPPEAKNLVQGMTKKLVNSLHKAAIFYDENKKMWRTTIIIEKGGTKKRKHVSAKTEEGLYNKLYDHYVGPGTLEDIHALWAEQRKEEGLASATLQRERQRWDKYLARTDLAKRRIDEIDNFRIEAHLLRIIRENSITTKELREIRFLLRKSFGYAFRHRSNTFGKYKKPRNPAWLLDFRAKKESARRDSNTHTLKKHRKEAGFKPCPVLVTQVVTHFYMLVY